MSKREARGTEREIERDRDRVRNKYRISPLTGKINLFQK